MSNILDMLLSFAFPNKCPICGKIIAYNKLVCSECEKITQSEFLKKEIANIDDIPICCVAPFKYKNLVRKSILNFKFNGKVSYSTFFSYMMVKVIKKYYSDIDVITFVPISNSRKINRQYDQCEVLAQKISKILNISCKNLLRKVINNSEQHKLNASERAKNVSGVYKVINPKNIINKNILLIDDICTTGNTLSECAKMLLKNGAKSVKCATITIDL